MKRIYFSLIVSMLSVLVWGQGEIVTVDGGKLQGVASQAQGVTVYKGIPYAAPPVGNLRWKRPQPVSPWGGDKVADTFSSISWQGGQQPGSFYWREFYQDEQPAMSEDCLYLNIWAPTASINDKQAKLPVAFWVHGGGFINGYGHEITMDGDEWVKRGVILVTINYRLGLLGFLSHPELSSESPDGVSGNYGTCDQIAALQWVHDNIASFGGDPDNITVMGQSAGGASIKNLVISPLSRGLMKRAIIQSAGGLGRFVEPEGDNAAIDAKGKNLMDQAGMTSLEMLRNAKAEDIVKLMAWGFASPHKDGLIIQDTFEEATMNGHLADIDYMIGCTLDDLTPMNKQIDAFCYARDSISTHPVYQYLFARKLPGSKDGAFHSAELWYMFHTLNRSWRPFAKADYRLADEMMDYWTNFAKYGNPNGKGKEETWPAFTLENPFIKTLNIR